MDVSTLLPQAVLPHRGAAKAGLRRFTLGNIDVFTTWQGTLVYAGVIALSLLAINRQQQDLALRNSLTLEPVRADVDAINRRPNVGGSDDRIAALRPLEQVQQRTPQKWLELVVAASRSLRECWTLLSPSPESCSCRAVAVTGFNSKPAGTLTQLQAPIEVRLDPPAGATDRVLWNGEPLVVDGERAGVYRVSELPAPDGEQPQTAPLVP